VRTSELNDLPVDKIDLLVLKQANIISGNALAAKVFLSGEITKKLNINGLLLTKGARAAIEAAGGKIAVAE
jgi:large subunit ribosomal protein L15